MGLELLQSAFEFHDDFFQISTKNCEINNDEPLPRQHPETEEQQLERIKLFFQTEFSMPEWSSRDIGRKWSIRKADMSSCSDNLICSNSKSDLDVIHEEGQEEVGQKDSTSSVRSSSSKRAGKLRGTKVHIRHLPKTMSEIELLEVLDPLPPYSYIHFISGKFMSTAMNMHMTGYCCINFCSFEDASRFVRDYAYFVLINERGQEFNVSCQFAINQRIHKGSSNCIQAKLHDYEFDENFVAFRDSYDGTDGGTMKSDKTCAEVMLKEIEEKKKKFKELQSSPLVEFIMSKEEEEMAVLGRRMDTVLQESQAKNAETDITEIVTSDVVISEPIETSRQSNDSAPGINSVPSVRVQQSSILPFYVPHNQPYLPSFFPYPQSYLPYFYSPSIPYFYEFYPHACKPSLLGPVPSLLSLGYPGNIGNNQHLQQFSQNSIKSEARLGDKTSSSRHEDLKKLKSRFHLAQFACTTNTKEAVTSKREKKQRNLSQSSTEDKVILSNEKEPTEWKCVPAQNDLQKAGASFSSRTDCERTGIVTTSPKTVSSNITPNTKSLQRSGLLPSTGDTRSEKLPQSITMTVTTGKPRPQALLEMKLPDMKLQVAKIRSKLPNSRKQNNVPNLATSNSNNNPSCLKAASNVERTNSVSCLSQNRNSSTKSTALQTGKAPVSLSLPKEFSLEPLSESQIPSSLIAVKTQPHRRKSRVFISTAKQQQRKQSASNAEKNSAEAKLQSAKSKPYPKRSTQSNNYDHSSKIVGTSQPTTSDNRHKKSSIYHRSQSVSKSFSSNGFCIKDQKQDPKPLLSLVIPPPRIFTRRSVSVSEPIKNSPAATAKQFYQSDEIRKEPFPDKTLSIVKTVYRDLIKSSSQSSLNPCTPDLQSVGCNLIIFGDDTFKNNQ